MQNPNLIQKLNHQPYFNEPKSPISNYSKSTVTHQNYSRVSNPKQYKISELQKADQRNSNQIKNFIYKNLTKHSKTLASPQLKDNVVQIQYMSNSRYIGQTIQTSEQYVKNGLGIYYYSNQDIYYGNFKNDAFHGNGVYLFSNGQKFQGIFHEGSSIKGKFYYKNGNAYEGEYANNNPNGYGIMKINSNPEKYFKGGWKDGKQNGNGQFQSSSLFVKGCWIDSIINDGKIQFKRNVNNPETHVYEGSIKNNQLNGQGKYFFNSNCHYTGQFKDGLFHGKGKITYENGDYYDGLFEYGLKEGYGDYYYKNGDSYHGQFCRDQKQGNGQIKFHNKNSYKGQFNKDKLQGCGTYSWNIVGPKQFKIQFIGEFKDGNLRSGEFYHNNRLIRKRLS